MADKANVTGIIVQPGGTVLVGRESTVADDGIAGINMRGYISCSYVRTANDSSANFHANNSGSNVSSSKESYCKTTGYNSNDYNLQIYDGCIDTAGVIKFIIAHSAADKKVMLADAGLSDVSFDTGTTSILDSTLSTPSAITIGKNGSAANTVVDVSGSNHTIRCGQGLNFYNGGTLLARASTLYLGTTSSSPYAGENSSRWGINLSVGKIGGASTSAAPTGTWYVSSIKSTTSSNTLRFTTGTCTITGKNTSSNRFFEITDGNIYHSDGTLTIDSGVAAEMQWDAASTDQDNGPYNFIINDASCTARIRSPLEILNDLDVTTGTFNTHSNDGGADKDLTVAGAVHIHSGGTLTCNTSAVSAYSMTVESSGTLNATSGTTTITGGGSPNYLGVSIKNGATFDNNDGTFQIDSSSESWLHRNVDNLDLVFHHLIINGANVYIQKGDIHCEGDLTINAGKALTPYNNHNNLTVDGDVILSGTLGKTQWGLNEPTRAACTFGSLTINSGGTYIATQNTTTITSKTASAARALDFAGTFTHNNGTVKLALPSTDWSNVYPNSAHFYNFIIDTGSIEGYYFNDPLIVLNNLDIQDGTIYANSASSNDGDITVYGLTTVGTGADAAKLENVARTVTLHGGITVGANGTFETGTGTNNVGGIRNLGGTIS